jgi:hypothetical protein
MTSGSGTTFHLVHVVARVSLTVCLLLCVCVCRRGGGRLWLRIVFRVTYTYPSLRPPPPLLRTVLPPPSRTSSPAILPLRLPPPL